MTDEQKWLLIFGSGWVPWYAVVDGPPGEQEVHPLHTRLTEAGKIEVDKNTMRVRLKKEVNEIIRV